MRVHFVGTLIHSITLNDLLHLTTIVEKMYCFDTDISTLNWKTPPESDLCVMGCAVCLLASCLQITNVGRTTGIFSVPALLRERIHWKVCWGEGTSERGYIGDRVHWRGKGVWGRYQCFSHPLRSTYYSLEWSDDLFTSKVLVVIMVKGVTTEVSTSSTCVRAAVET